MNATVEQKRLRQLLIGHGAMLLFLGGVLGFGFFFFLVGEIKLWPIPGSIDYQMPGSYDAWRMAHIEGILNGLLLWLTAAILPLLPFSATGQKRTAWWMIVIGWTIVVASALDPLFPESRGLVFGGPLTNYIAFFLFYVGVVAVMVVMAIIAWRCLKPGAHS